MSLRLRIAPSPTGDLHLGTLRTVIFNYLVVHQQPDGVFMVRIEDTDRNRLVEGSVEKLAEALRWMGIEPDEGVCLDERGKLTEKGSYGPYTQSERLEIYNKYAAELLDSGAAYRCFCTSERLEEMRAEQQKNHQPPRYDRRCRAIPREESDTRAKSEPFVIRQAMPDEGEVKFTDVVRGEISFQVADLDDQVLVKSDGFPTYFLASIVDDHLMEISHVLRGEEWLSSTPKNLLLYKAFGWEAPQFAHLPVILGPDGRHKLSKRDGDVSVLNYRDKGYLPEALFNMLAFVGWSPGTEEEFLTREQLIEKFRLEKVQKAAAIFSFERLDFMNGWYIRQMPIEKLLEHMTPWLVSEGLLERAGEGYRFTNDLEVEGTVAEYLPRVGRAVQERLKHFDETVEASGFFFKRPDISPEFLELIVPKKGTLEDTIAKLRESVKVIDGLDKKRWEEPELHDALMEFIAKAGYKNGDVLWPIRAALTGVAGSPGCFEMLTLLGKTESLARLHAVLEAVS